MHFQLPVYKRERRSCATREVNHACQLSRIFRKVCESRPVLGYYEFFWKFYRKNNVCKNVRTPVCVTSVSSLVMANECKRDTSAEQIHTNS